MKNTAFAILFALILAGATLAQNISPGQQNAAGGYKPRIAVLEFKAGPKASQMSREEAETLQKSFAETLGSNFNVADLTATKTAVGNELLTLNGPGTGPAAAKVGKLLGVDYVLTGTVLEYGITDVRGIGRMTVKTELINVSTGRAKWFAEVRYESAGITRIGAGTLEMTERVLKPSVQRLTASLKAADL